MDAKSSITGSSDKTTQPSDENSMELVTGKSLSPLNTCGVPLVKYAFGEKSSSVYLFN